MNLRIVMLNTISVVYRLYIKLGFVMQQYMFYFAISDYCFCQYNVYESPRDDVNGGVFI